MSNLYNICVVDDDVIYQYTTMKIIEILKISKKQQVFSDGEKALEFIQRHINDENELPDILLLDINMPIMDGFQFMEEYVKFWTQIKKKINIYIVSSSVDPLDIEKSKKMIGVSGYVTKPVKLNDIKQIIAEI